MDALVVYDAAKLPPDIQKLQDHDRPLAPDVQFFEEKFTFADVAKQLVWGVILIPVGAIVAVVSQFMFFHVDRTSPSYDSMLQGTLVATIFGILLFLLGGWLLKTLWSKYQLVRRQRNGLATRHGVFLVGDLLIYRSDMSTKVVPKPSFRGMKGRAVQFEHEGQVKSLELPAELVGKDAPSLDNAVAAWAA